jgi:DNA polymerase lambda
LREVSSKKRKIPALKLTTLVPPVTTKEITHDPHPLSSPIEDSNDPPPKSAALPPTSDSKSALQAGPSRLYLEVMERVAQHSSTKRRNKVIKLNTKAVSVHDNGPSVIDISSSPPPSDRAVIKSGSTKRESLQDAKSKTKPIKGKKVKPPAMTPLEYAHKLREKATLAPRGAPKKSVNRFLEGMRIFYIGGDMQFASEQTRGRMSLVCSPIIFSDTVIGLSEIPTLDRQVWWRSAPRLRRFSGNSYNH